MQQALRNDDIITASSRRARHAAEAGPAGLPAAGEVSFLPRGRARARQGQPAGLGQLPRVLPPWPRGAVWLP